MGIYQGGIGGDHHFVGLDGVRFDYDGEGWHLLWDSPGAVAIAHFTKDSRGDVLSLGRYTWMNAIQVVANGGVHGFSREGMGGFDADFRAVEAATGLVRGIPSELGHIAGEVRGMQAIEFRGGRFVVSLMEHEGIPHLNFSVQVEGEMPMAGGLLGQTALDPKLRRAPGSFRFPI